MQRVSGSDRGTEVTVDLAIIGGGINGAGIARDAAGRGLKVLLLEKGDLGRATSSASSKLIHGGLRYLEQFAFRLVRESLNEREVMLTIAPHLVRPMTFVLPHTPDARPVWMLRLGLWLYDHLGKRRRLAPSAHVNLRETQWGRALNGRFKDGFTYADCWVDDARLVVLTALDAAERGADVRPRTACLRAARGARAWALTLETADGGTEQVTARAVVNATGPWAETVDREILGLTPPGQARLVRGSHIIVPRLYEGDHAYILQTEDQRIVFVIPYEGDFTMIGTTEVDQDRMTDRPAATEAEIAYLSEAVRPYLARAVGPADVVASFAGVRPLWGEERGGEEGESARTVSREYSLMLDREGGAPVLSVHGGKLTTYRRLAEEAMEKLAPVFEIPGRNWTAGAALPGGDMPNADFDGFAQGMAAAYPWLPDALRLRYARAYGTRMSRLLAGRGSMADLGVDISEGHGLYEAEVDYLTAHEWARTAEDILWRRTKIGLKAGADAAARLDAWLALHRLSKESKRERKKA